MDFVCHAVSGPVGTITIDRPDAMNAVSPAVIDGLNAALDDLNRAVALDANCAEAYKHRAVVYAAIDGNVLETSRGSRAVYDAYLSLTLNPNYAPAKG